MLKNYFVIAQRNLRKHPGSTLISVGGLAVGLAASLLIGMYVMHEMSYDEHFERSEDLFRVAWFGDNPQTRTPHPMAQAMVDDLPEVEAAVSLSPIWGPGLTRPEITFQNGDNRYREGRVLSADSTFFDVFSFDFLHGSPSTALSQIGGVVLTESTARKYFGSENPMGKPLMVNDEFELFVSGVVTDVPETTHFHFDILVSYVTLKLQETGAYYEWADFGHFNYVLLNENARSEQMERRINDWVRDYVAFSPGTIERMNADTMFGFRLQPVTDIHLKSNIRWELEPNGRMAYVYILSAAALIILLISCVNFINLSTAGSQTRKREVGVRKALGAGRIDLAGQFLCQGFIVTLLAMTGALGIVEITLPVLNAFLGYETGLLHSFRDAVPLLAGLFLVVGLLAGGYPAFIISSYRPVLALAGRTGESLGAGLFRKSLIVFQFAASVALVVAILAIKAQLSYVENTSLGMEAERVVTIPVESGLVSEQYESLRERWLEEPSVLSVAAVSNIPGGNFNQQPLEWRPGRDQIDVSPWRVDSDFLQVLGIELAHGRSFSRDRPADRDNAFLLNETAVRQLGMESPIGERITFMDDDEAREGTVIGVLEDFHFKSLHREIEPMIVEYRPSSMSYILVKLRSASSAQMIGALSAGWSDVFPDIPFTSDFLDATISAQYRSERQMGALLTLFASIALVLACLGLFGLVALDTHQRTKEIGIRRVLGGSVAGIVLLFSLDYLKLVGVALLTGGLVSAVLVNDWLSNFAYSTRLGFEVFLWAGIIVTGVAMLTVAWQAARSATDNPVDSLRSE